MKLFFLNKACTLFLSDTMLLYTEQTTVEYKHNFDMHWKTEKCV